MTASVAKSPTLLPFDHKQDSSSGGSGGSASRLGTSPRSPAAAAQNFIDLYNRNKQAASFTQRGLDSSDVEAQRQEKQRLAEQAQAQSQSQHASAAAMVTTPSGEESLANIAATAATTADLDPQGPFEGPEKLLELWFADCPDLLPVNALRASFTILQNADGTAMPDALPRQRLGLRAVPRAQWEGMLDIVKCKVLSVIEGQDVDAYLLSESSMFVFPHKIILKTCGTTTLLLGLQRLLELARWAVLGGGQEACSTSVTDGGDVEDDVAGNAYRKQLGTLVQQCFYSRKSFMFPERQKGPHRDWMLEVKLLDAFLDNGSAYTVGKMNGDHWLLYMCCPGDVTPGVERPLRLPPPASSLDIVTDRTLEILMTHLSPSSCSSFEFPADMPVPTGSTDRGHALGLSLSDKLGLTTLFPHTQLDAFAFEPCGYSANAVIPASQGSTAGYWTIHVTPEEGSSYASFETNVALTGQSNDAHPKHPHDLATLIQRVVDIFQPGRMSVTLFTSSRDEEQQQAKDDGSVLHSLNLPGYARRDRIAYEFDHYDLVFCHFEGRGKGRAVVG